MTSFQRFAARHKLDLYREANLTTVYRGYAFRVHPDENYNINPSFLGGMATRGLWTTDRSNAQYYASHERDYISYYEFDGEAGWLVEMVMEAQADATGFEPNPDRSLDDQNNEMLITQGVTPISAEGNLCYYENGNCDWEQPVLFVYENGTWVNR